MHWEFDKTQAIRLGKRIDRYVLRNAFAPLEKPKSR
jgi:hypothetical protein